MWLYDYPTKTLASPATLAAWQSSAATRLVSLSPAQNIFKTRDNLSTLVRLNGVCAMDSDVSGFAETDENILILDVPDDALERAAGGTDGKITTYVYCTYAWYICSVNE